jgi:soluble P-type ATPase
MNMGVVIEATIMSVQNRGHADLDTKVFGIQAKVFECARSTSKEKAVKDALAIPGKKSQLIRKGKGCHEVLNRQELGLLTIQPEGGFMILTLRAASVPT